MRRETNRNKFSVGEMPVCKFRGCGLRLSSRDVSEGRVFHSDECYYSALIEGVRACFGGAHD